jgi:uncharacterized protein YebE (UPF0316 family)
MQLLIYFIVALVLDILGTLDFYATLKMKAFKSGFIVTISSILGDLAFLFILLSPNTLWDKIYNIIAYGIGAGVGAILVILYKKRNERRK